MKSDPSRLVQHLALAVVLKLAVIAGLWFAFVQDARVAVGPERAAAHIGSAPPPPSGAPQ
jgi:hypothetical protein